jgi:broad specificity phosphatase PhoE
MKKVFCIRHGKSTHNVDFNERGEIAYSDPKHEDANLVPLGIYQATKLSSEWKDKENIELVITSPLSRTMDTTVHILKNTNIPVIVLDEAREYPLGRHLANKRKNKTTLQCKYPEFNFSNICETVEDTGNETFEELKERVYKTKQFIKNRNEKNIALVCHSSFLKEFMQKDTKIEHCEPMIIEL